MNYKIYILFLVLIISTKGFSQSTTDTVLTEYYNGSDWTPYEADIITYNDDCQVTESNTYNHNGNRWDTIRRNQYVYDTEGRLQEFTRQRWSTSISNPGWQNDYRNIYYYSSDGITDTVVWQSWAFGNNGYYWRNDTREIHQYNTQNSETYHEYNYYDNSQQAWIVRDRTSTSYDSYNRSLGYVSQQRTNNQWVNSSKAQTTYDSDSALTYYYSWNANTNTWNKNARIYMNLLGYTSKIEASTQQFLSGNMWMNALKEIRQYNTDSLNTKYTYQGWNGTQWINSSRAKTSYYTDNVVKRINSDLYNMGTNTWEQSDRILYTNHGCAVSAEWVPINKNEAKTEAITRNRQGYSYIFSNGRTGAGQGYKLVLTTGRQKNKIISSTKQSAVATTTLINIFPNPAKDYFMVDVKDAGRSFITITNLSGKQVLQQSLKSGSQKIDITALAKGFYVVSVTTNGQVKNQKLLVE